MTDDSLFDDGPKVPSKAEASVNALSQLYAARKALEEAKAELIAVEERFLYATGWTRHPTLKDNWRNTDTTTHRRNAVMIEANEKEG